MTLPQGAAAPPPVPDRLQYFARLYDAYRCAEIDMTRSPAETMDNEWYETIGRSGAQAVYAGCVSSWLEEVRAVLDIPCGHGRVLRHLVKLFPGAAVDACDIDRAGVEFCARQFQATGVVSTADPDDLALPRLYDVIWVGSFFTHLSRPLARAWMARLCKQLTQAGVIVATFHGRWSAEKGGAIGYIDPAKWKAIVSGYRRSGYGYADYAGSHQHSDYIRGGYGVSLSAPSAVVADAVSIPGVRIFGFTERGWAGHQDVLVFGKPALMND